MILTIAIPTFDRAAELSATVARLLPQLVADTELLILDNASPIPAAEAIRPLLDANPAVPIRIVRHAANIGANGNLLRAFELTSSEWMWVLGDDDAPAKDAVASCLAAIREADDALCINFRSSHGCAIANFRTRGRAELIEKFPTWGNLLFISTNLYRRSPLQAHLHMGYRFAYSMATHVVMLLLAVEPDGLVAFRNDAIVEASSPDGAGHWSAINQSLSVPTVLELPLTPRERSVLARKLHLPDLPNLMIQLLGTGVRRGEFASSRFYYREITARLWPYTPLHKRLLILVGHLAWLSPRSSLWLVSKLLKRAKGSDVMSRLRAEVDDPRI